MSYDVSIEADGCHADHSANYTSNLAGAWDAAGAPLREWNGKKAHEVADALQAAATELWTKPDQYRKYEPDNEWGDIQGAEMFLRTILEFCRLHPDGTVRVFR